MTGKTITGKGFSGCFEYAIYGKKENVQIDEKGNKIPRGKIIGGTMAGHNKAELMREFQMAKELSPNKTKPVAHHILTFAPEDEPKLNDRKMSEISDMYMKNKGYTDNAVYTVIKHSDTDNTHLHIIASTTEIDGRHVWLARTKDVKICRQIEKIYKLRELSDKPKNQRKPLKREEIGYKERTGNLTMREIIQNAIDSSLVEKPNGTQFVERLQEKGIFVKANLQNTGRIAGISFAAMSPEGKLIAFKGSDLGKGYAWTRLSEKIDYSPNKDEETLREATIETKKIEQSDKSKSLPSAEQKPMATEKLISKEILTKIKESVENQKLKYSEKAWKSLEQDLTDNYSKQKPSDNQIKLLEKWQTNTKLDTEKMTRLEAIKELLLLAGERERHIFTKNTMDFYEKLELEKQIRENQIKEKSTNEKTYFDR
jgi:hypothetical protein